MPIDTLSAHSEMAVCVRNIHKCIYVQFLFTYEHFLLPLKSQYNPTRGKRITYLQAMLCLHCTNVNQSYLSSTQNCVFCTDSFWDYWLREVR